jgi:hypothetical protein
MTVCTEQRGPTELKTRREDDSKHGAARADRAQDQAGGRRCARSSEVRPSSRTGGRMTVRTVQRGPTELKIKLEQEGAHGAPRCRLPPFVMAASARLWLSAFVVAFGSENLTAVSLMPSFAGDSARLPPCPSYLRATPLPVLPSFCQRGVPGRDL